MELALEGQHYVHDALAAISCYEDSCGRSGLKEYNVWSGFSEFPEELGFQSKYNYCRSSSN